MKEYGCSWWMIMMHTELTLHWMMALDWMLHWMMALHWMMLH
jgi:hypothetical protein